MSIRAGHIVFVGGRNVIDRLQQAGITGNVPIDTVREIGNDLVVDKVPTEADYTFTMENWDVTTDMIAFLQGQIGDQAVASPPGHGDAPGTEYKWENCGYVNVTSPWKDDTGSQGGHIGAGLILPAYYPTRLRYQLGVTAAAAQTVELHGGEFYYGNGAAPVEETAAGDGGTTVLTTSEAARALRLGGPSGTTFQRVFGVLVNGVPQTKDIDYVEGIAGGGLDAGADIAATLTFATAPPNLAVIRYLYFSTVAKTVPQAVNADATVKPGEVRGRDIVIKIGGHRIPGTQSFELDATVAGGVERMMGTSQVIGYSVDGTDVTGNLVFRPRDRAAFFEAINFAIGVSEDELVSHFYQEIADVEIEIHNPKNTGEIIKTLYVAQGQLQPPPLPARVNTATDFTMAFNAADGTFSEFKGSKPAATTKTRVTGVVGDNNAILWSAKYKIRDIAVGIIIPNVAHAPLAIDIDAHTVVVTAATGAVAGVTTTTAADVIAAVTASAAGAFVTVASDLTSDGTGLVAAAATAPLA